MINDHDHDRSHTQASARQATTPSCGHRCMKRKRRPQTDGAGRSRCTPCRLEGKRNRACALNRSGWERTRSTGACGSVGRVWWWWWWWCVWGRTFTVLHRTGIAADAKSNPPSQRFPNTCCAKQWSGSVCCPSTTTDEPHIIMAFGSIFIFNHSQYFCFVRFTLGRLVSQRCGQDAPEPDSSLV